jgi:hypothetical protein
MDTRRFPPKLSSPRPRKNLAEGFAESRVNREAGTTTDRWASSSLPSAAQCTPSASPRPSTTTPTARPSSRHRRRRRCACRRCACRARRRSAPHSCRAARRRGRAVPPPPMHRPPPRARKLCERAWRTCAGSRARRPRSRGVRRFGGRCGRSGTTGTARCGRLWRGMRAAGFGEVGRVCAFLASVLPRSSVAGR